MDILNAIIKEGTPLLSGGDGKTTYRTFEFRGNKFKIDIRRID